MKTTSIPLIIILLLSSSCYLNEKDDGRIVFRLNPPAPADVARLHIAAYENSGTEENLLLYQVVNPDSIVDIEVPAGNRRIFTIWAEGHDGHALYYGTTQPVDIDGGDSLEVSLRMYRFDDTSAVPVFDIYWSNPFVRWNAINGATAYELRNGNGGIIYFGPDNYLNTGNGDSFEVRAYSSTFGIYSDSVIMGW